MNNACTWSLWLFEPNVRRFHYMLNAFNPLIRFVKALSDECLFQLALFHCPRYDGLASLKRYIAQLSVQVHSISSPSAHGNINKHKQYNLQIRIFKLQSSLINKPNITMSTLSIFHVLLIAISRKKPAEVQGLKADQDAFVEWLVDGTKGCDWDQEPEPVLVKLTTPCGNEDSVLPTFHWTWDTADGSVTLGGSKQACQWFIRNLLRRDHGLSPKLLPSHPVDEERAYSGCLCRLPLDVVVVRR